MKKNMIKSTVLAMACIVILAAGSAFAGTATSNMSVSATVSANCTISAGALAFGAYDPIVANAASPLPGTASITVTCTNGSPTTRLRSVQLFLTPSMLPVCSGLGPWSLSLLVGLSWPFANGQFADYPDKKVVTAAEEVITPAKEVVTSAEEVVIFAQEVGPKGECHHKPVSHVLARMPMTSGPSKQAFCHDSPARIAATSLCMLTSKF